MKMQEFTFMKGEGQVKKYIMVIDEGTTGTRALLFDKDFNIVSQSYEEFTQYTPSEDKVEHDAMEIYDKTIDMCKKAMAQAGAAPEEISGIGITNQRATTVIWDKETGVPLCKAIVWQDNRTADRCAQINDSEWGKKCKQATGWTVAPVYSSLMVEWLMKNNEEVNRKLRDGSALFGTIDTWLVWKLTGGKRHTISYSNASVTGSPEQPACQYRRRNPFKRTGISAGTLRRQTPERGGHLDAAAVRGIQHPRPQHRQPESSRPESITRTDLRRQPRCHQGSILRNTPGL